MLQRTLVVTIPVLLISVSASALPKEPVEVTRVVDGDTFHVESGDEDITVRVLGIDCPESRAVKKCGKYRKGLSCKDEIQLGKAATREAKRLLSGVQVKLEQPEGTKKDVFRRNLAYVRLPDGRDFGLAMIEGGFCRDFGWKYPHPRMRDYAKVQVKAARD